ncbi:TPA: 23S rRNA (uracil(1939)-C(5))-methyltransferase RlmD [Staphylococcus aureus]|nr:23S rRNA (uracil(1939)-C(5))-methyltransferase RlmD [Staphylococcus aureus]
MQAIAKNDIKTGTVVDLTHEGHGVVKIDRFPIFIPQALINEQIEYKIIKVKKNFAIGKLLNINTRSENRVAPPCIYYERCGGCQLQHLSYEAQLEMKKEQVINLFQRKAHFDNSKINDTVGMTDPWRYRNKSQIPVGKNEQNEVKSILKDLNVSIYQEQLKKGLMRHLVVRTGYHTDEMMIIFVTNGKKWPQKNAVVEKILDAFPNVTSIKQNINDSHSNVIMGRQSITLYGKDTIIDQLTDSTFKISDQSFYQINSEQTEKLYNKAIEYAQLTGNEVVLDTYCGIGTIGLYMAPHAKHVYGVEVVPSSIEDAQQNATINQCNNTTFVCGKAEEVILQWKAQGIKPDVVMVDPPRKGCDETFIQTLLTLEPKRIVYISCNPATQQRDALLLAEKYQLEEVTPVDMFPQTTHVETVALFNLK